MPSTESAVPTWFNEPTFGQRILARLFDGVLVIPIGLLLGALVEGRVARTVMLVVLTLVYEVGFTTAWDGQTPGKRTLGIRIRSLDGELSSRQLVLRALVTEVARVPGWVGAAAVFLVYLPILKGPLHQGVHDRVAGTVVSSVKVQVPEATC